MQSSAGLSQRYDAALPSRLAKSARERGAGSWIKTEEVSAWLAERRRAHRFQVDRIPFSGLQGWHFQQRTGNLTHHSGRFFSVEGLQVTVEDSPARSWGQPIINQPEIGVLGILAKEFDGVLHFLMQAKMEPGNPNLLQLSPTVQATRSNYTKVHCGAGVKHLEHFTGAGRHRVLADVLQSEHGSWFHRKVNRNVLVETADEVQAGDDFCWLTLGQIGELLRRDNTVNMDARSALACLPAPQRVDQALHTDTEVLSWCTAERARHDVKAELVPLNAVDNWVRGEYSIDHVNGRYFRVVAVAVQAGSREVAHWTQPLFEPARGGVVAFLTRRIGGVPHVLAHARVEGGFAHTIELGPTVQCTPRNWSHVAPAHRPPFLDLVLNSPSRKIRYETVHSEEGGRFLNAESRYLFVDADPSEAPLEAPQGFCWVTQDQLAALAQHSHYVSVQARSLLAVLNAGAVEL